MIACIIMTLESEIQKILDDFESIPTERILDVLRQIMPHFKNDLISEYLQGKIQKILDSSDDAEKKNQCKALKPYLDWYLQGV